MEAKAIKGPIALHTIALRYDFTIFGAVILIFYVEILVANIIIE